METTIIGAMPKLPSSPGEVNLRRTIQDFDAGRIGPGELEAAYRTKEAQVLMDQVARGITVLGDGQVRWDDLVSPLGLDVANYVPGGLVRFFTNNTYYRRPTITGRLALAGSTLAARFARVRAQASRPLKAALPGPYTALTLALDQQYTSMDSALADACAVWALLIEAHAEAGAHVMELEEPALARERDAGRRRAALQAIGALGKSSPVPLRLALYFGDVAPWAGELADLPLHGISFDLAQSPRMWDVLAEGFPGVVGLGLVDARDLRFEDVDETAARVRLLLKRLGTERLWLHPNTSLEYLPADAAMAKLELVGEIRRRVEREVHP